MSELDFIEEDMAMHYGRLSFDEDVLDEHQRVLDLPAERFTDYILEQSDPYDMNTTVRNGNFPAYDIAKRLNDKGKLPTPKQRQSLTNVYMHCYKLAKM